jgi:UDP-glucose 4-epimerase
MRQLFHDSSALRILGDGNQRKSYLHVKDCVEAIVSMLDADHRCEVFNLGVDAYCTVRESVSWICERLAVEPELQFTGGDRGWVGDNPFIYLDVDKMRRTGWEPTHSIRQAVEETVDYLRENEWVVGRSEVRA